AVIQFFGGIHEIYFPYVLMKPKLILAVVLGGMAGVATNLIFDSGLRAPAAPGSIIAVWLQAPASSLVGVTLSVIVAAGVSFTVASALLKMERAEDEGDLAAATANMESMKGKKSLASSVLTSGRSVDIKSIVFACDAGMGSSAMGASVLRKKIKAAGYGDVSVVNKAISNLNDGYDLVVTHQDLTERAKQKSPSAIHVSVDDFMGSPRYDEIVEMIDESGDATAASRAESTPAEPADDVLASSAIVLGGTARSRDEAITEAGQLLVDSGAVEPAYVDAMHTRESSVSTHMGNGLAIPHGTNEAKGSILRTAISFVRYDEPIDWNGKPAEFVLGIAGAGDDHLALLSRIAEVFTNEESVARLREARTPEDVLATLDAVKV
ncbi:MAG TPA: PTS sugar transporter subunit IIA, partial [Nocardioides sp.]|nr:PTS sugar transporter subunit IIA [Nocardioides sp.]